MPNCGKVSNGTKKKLLLKNKNQLTSSVRKIWPGTVIYEHGFNISVFVCSS